ncbi:MAG: phage antirepressor KilAC domain-containing protein [Prevotella sp.]|nr:phage antirepressor KilAC domain-containing protein [Prevotella sp.]
METNITIFNNPQFGDIRTAGTADNPLFCLVDVCKALDLQPSAVMRRLDDGVISSNPISDSLGRQQIANFVNEDGLYDVILDSRKSEAKTFRKWITSDVLPSIRKTGSYSLPSGYLPDFSNPAEAARAWADQYEKVQTESKRALEAERQVLELSDTVASMKPKAEYYDIILASKETVTITQIAQDYGMSAKAFNVLLRNFGIQHKVAGQWILYAKYLPFGYVQSEPILIDHKNGMKETKMFSKWTQKGRLFLYEELKRRSYIPLIERAA